MKSFFTRVSGIVFLILGAQHMIFSQTRTSHKTGFYAQDSVFFESLYQPQPGEQVLISVNRFTDEGFVPYTGGVWLYNRNLLPNTWEDQQLTRAGWPSWYDVDTLSPRGHLNKVNVVRMRVMTDSSVTDSVYFIGVSGSGVTDPVPYTIPVAFIFVDSLDAFGPYGFYGPGVGIPEMYFDQNNNLIVPENGDRAWNYEVTNTFAEGIFKNRKRKPAMVQIIEPGGQCVLDQKVTIQISGQASVHLPNRTMMIRPEKKYGSGKIVTNLLNPGGEPEKWESLKFRTGGSNTKYAFASNEIGLGIMQGTKLGGIPYRPVMVYLNGSFWTMAFVQPRMDNHTIGKMYPNASQDSVTIIATNFFAFSSHTPNISNVPVEQVIQTMHEHVPDSDFDYDMLTKIFDRQDVEASVIISEGADSVRVTLGLLRSGTDVFDINPEVRNIVDVLMDTLSTVDVYDRLDSVISIDKFLLYLTTVDFLILGDHIVNNVYLAHVKNRKPFLVMTDFDDATYSYYSQSVWGQNIGKLDTENKFHCLILGQLLSSQKAIDRLALIYQDHLNTTFRPERTIPIIQGLQDQIIPDYNEHYVSWPETNSGPPPSYLNMMLNIAKDFSLRRPDVAAQKLADFWYPDDSMRIDNRKEVRVVMDSLPAGIAKLKLNSLKIRSNFEGIYFPKPALQIELIVEDGYDVHFKEYPDSGLSFSIFADSAITLTPVWGKIPSPLPIELATFHCSVQAGKPLLEWITLSEFNSREFIIERSPSAIDFTAIGKIPSIGSLEDETHYSFIDHFALHSGSVYYRVRQVDWDGTYSFTDICVVNNQGGEHPLVFPSPANTEINFSAICSGEIWNAIGVRMKQFTTTNIVDISDFPSGIYLVKFEGFSDPVRFFKNE